MNLTQFVADCLLDLTKVVFVLNSHEVDLFFSLDRRQCHFFFFDYAYRKIPKYLDTQKIKSNLS